MEGGKRAWLLLLTLLVVEAALLWFSQTHSGSLYDDAYIYFRYAQNVWAGCGLRFNCEDPAVEGFSSPVYLALLVLGRFVTSELETIARVVCTLAMALALAATLYTAHVCRWFESRWAESACLLGVGLMSLDPFLQLNSVIGLDGPVMMLVIGLLFWAIVTGKTRLIGVFALLAALTRPEGVLFVLALPLLKQARSWRFLGTVSLALLIAFLMRLAVFGDVLPNTYFAKAGGSGRHAELGLEYLGSFVKDFPLVLLSPMALLIPRARPAAIYIGAVSIVWLGSFLRTGGDTFGYSRLAIPLVPTLLLLGSAGLVEALLRLSQRVGRGPMAAGAAAVVVTLALGARAQKAHALAPSHGFANVLQWRTVGRYLRQELPGARVATVPIGAISYVSEQHVIDLVGLTNRAIARSGSGVPPDRLDRNWIGHERHDTEWVLSQRPDVIVTTKFRDTPWTLPEARAGFIADWELLQLIKAGRIPYHVHNAEIARGTHYLMFIRDGFTAAK